MSQKICGRITNYRIGPKSQTSRECLIEFETVNSASLACKLIGQKVVWKSGSNKFVGKIMGAHGRNGIVRVRFVHGVPGQAIGTLVELAS
ncbi:MAG: 50S ribosomal protein L35ae [Candidatus Bathyarchaeia archaeon]